MHIDRRGKNRNAGTTKLVDKTISLPGKSKSYSPWNADTASVQWWVDGKDRGSNYRYTIKMSLGELLACIDAGITEVCDDRSKRAVGFGAIATLRELLAGTSESENVSSAGRIKFTPFKLKTPAKKSPA